MPVIRDELVYAAIERAYALIDYNIHDNLDELFEFLRQTILADKSLTKDEKSEAIKLLNESYDRGKVLHNEGKKRICENCQEECLATLYCEYCIRNYLKAKFSNWNYIKWDPKEQQLKRYGTKKVILKMLKNVESANRSWFEEVCNLLMNLNIIIILNNIKFKTFVGPISSNYK